MLGLAVGRAPGLAQRVEAIIAAKNRPGPPRRGYRQYGMIKEVSGGNFSCMLRQVV